LKERRATASLFYAITILDQFRDQPLPFSKLYKVVGKRMTGGPAKLQESFLNYVLVNIGQTDSRIEDCWKKFKKEIENFQPYHDQFKKMRTYLIFTMFIGIFSIAILSKHIIDTLAFPDWTALLFIIIAIVPFYHLYNIKEKGMVEKLRNQWKAGFIAKNLVEYLAPHIVKKAQEEGIDVRRIRFTSNHKDYRNFKVIEKRKTKYVLSPK